MVTYVKFAWVSLQIVVYFFETALVLEMKKISLTVSQMLSFNEHMEKVFY